MAFRWRVDDGLLIDVVDPLSPYQLKKIKFKMSQIWTSSDQNVLDPRMSVTPLSALLMLNICCKCLQPDDLYNISSLIIIPEKKKEEATNPFYSNRLSLMCME